jgi:hypothetical protein
VKSRATGGFWKYYWALPGNVRDAAQAAYKKFR